MQPINKLAKYFKCHLWEHYIKPDQWFSNFIFGKLDDHSNVMSTACIFMADTPENRKGIEINFGACHQVSIHILNNGGQITLFNYELTKLSVDTKYIVSVAFFKMDVKLPLLYCPIGKSEREQIEWLLTHGFISPDIAYAIHDNPDIVLDCPLLLQDIRRLKETSKFALEYENNQILKDARPINQLDFTGHEPIQPFVEDNLGRVSVASPYRLDTNTFILPIGHSLHFLQQVTDITICTPTSGRKLLKGVCVEWIDEDDLTKGLEYTESKCLIYSFEEMSKTQQTPKDELHKILTALLEKIKVVKELPAEIDYVSIAFVPDLEKYGVPLCQPTLVGRLSHRSCVNEGSEFNRLAPLNTPLGGMFFEVYHCNDDVGHYMFIMDTKDDTHSVHAGVTSFKEYFKQFDLTFLDTITRHFINGHNSGHGVKQINLSNNVERLWRQHHLDNEFIILPEQSEE